MAKSKYIMHDCAYCHKPTKMELVGEMQVEGEEGPPLKLWYRCLRCKHTALLERESLQKDKSNNGLALDRTASTEYSKFNVYSIGQLIYHTDWDDVGKVTAKQKTSDGTQAITVSFEKSGERKLIENVPHSAEEEIIQNISTQA